MEKHKSGMLLAQISVNLPMKLKMVNKLDSLWMTILIIWLFKITREGSKKGCHSLLIEALSESLV